MLLCLHLSSRGPHGKQDLWSVRLLSDRDGLQPRRLICRDGSGHTWTRPPRLCVNEEKRRLGVSLECLRGREKSSWPKQRTRASGVNHLMTGKPGKSHLEAKCIYCYVTDHSQI